MNFSLATSADVAEILPLMIEFNRGEGIPWRAAPMTAALRRVIDDPRLGTFLLARDEASGTLAGYCLATFGFDIEYAGRDAFVTELFVRSESRGSGLGRALLKAMIDRLRDAQVGAVHLVVRPENDRARALYAALGFAASPRILMTRRLEGGG
jgi:ribosomal protein S18 acetylase RimI-like enzyme